MTRSMLNFSLARYLSIIENLVVVVVVFERVGRRISENLFFPLLLPILVVEKKRVYLGNAVNRIRTDYTPQMSSLTSTPWS